VALGKDDKGLYLHAGLRNKVVADNVAESIDSVRRLTPRFIACHSTLEMWHFRLDYPFFEQMRCMNLPSFNKRKQGSVCQICPMTKMHRLPFPLGYSKASKLFELLYMDIWGLIHIALTMVVSPSLL